MRRAASPRVAARPATGRGRPVTPLAWLGVLLVAYLCVPVVAFLIRVAGAHTRGFDTPGLWASLRTSVVAATIATALVTLVGVPLAYRLARSPGRLASAVGIAIVVPLALPPVMAGIVLIYVVGPYTSLGGLFGGHLTDTLVGVVIAQTFVASPFLVISARSAFAAVDADLEDVAAALGLGPTARFFRVALPAAAAGIRAGMLLTWLRAFGEYGATVLLAYHPYSLSVFTYVQFSGSGIPTTQAPTLLAIAMAVAVGALGRLELGPLRRMLARRDAANRGTTNPSASNRSASNGDGGELRPGRPPRALPPTPVDFDIEVLAGAFHLRARHRAESHRIAIVGPSGSGKSMTLRSIAGLLGPAAGPVRYGDTDVTEVRTEARRIGYVPQTPALLARRTVWQHVMLAPDADADLARWWLAALGLTGLEDRLPSELSGGQRQRVLLAQALSREPALLLLDEPFSALDTPVREELRAELRRLQREAGLSTILVTHDPEEAALLADEIIVLVDGRIVQAGPRSEVFACPASRAIGRLLGIANLHTGRVHSPAALTWGDLVVDDAPSDLPPGTEVLWAVDPYRLTLAADGYPGRVLDVADRGASAVVEVEVGKGRVLEVRVPSPAPVAAGQECRLRIPTGAIRMWPAGGTIPNFDSSRHIALS